MAVTSLRFLLITSFFCISLSVIARKPNVVNFYRDTYDASNKNWAIAQDTLGIMYFGNDKGLLEFDGIRWKLHSLPTSEVIRAVAISSDNSIFTGGYEEFGVWKRNVYGELIYTSLSSSLQKGEDLHNDDIWKILVTDSLVYFQSFSHIYRYDYQDVSVVRGSESMHILFLMQVYNELFIQRISGNLCRFTSNGLEDIPESAFLSNTEIRLILPYTDNRYLIGTSNRGLFIYDGKSFTSWDSEFSELVKPYQLNNGILMKNGNYFFGTILNGLYEVDLKGNIINHFSTNNLLQNNTVLSLLEDDGNNIWVALDRGISNIQYMRSMDCYTDQTGRIGAIYSAAFFEDKLFLGTNQGLYFIEKEKLNSSYVLSDIKHIGEVKGQVWDLNVIEGELFCGYNNGLVVIDEKLNLMKYRMTGVYKIKQVEYRNKKAIFLGTYTSAVILSSDHKQDFRFEYLTEPISQIETDHLGNIWLKHFNKGLYRYRFSEAVDDVKLCQAYGGESKDNLPFLINLFKIGNRVVFYGDNKFYAYDDLADQIVFYKEFNDVIENLKPIKKIIRLSDNYCLAIAENGCLYKLYYDGYDIRLVDKYDIGFNNLSLVNRYENAISLDDSLALICLDNGFLMFHKNEKPSEAPILQTPVISTITVSGAKNENKLVKVRNVIPSIAFSSNNIHFEFFTSGMFSKNLFFQYRLVGVNNEWSIPGKINEVMYERLPEGSYTFMLRTVDNLGNFSGQEEFPFIILPPWYANGIAYIVYIFLFLASMTGIWFMLLRRFRNKHLIKVRLREQRRLTQINQNLQKEIEEKNEELFTQASFIIQKNEQMIKVKEEIEDFYQGYEGNKAFRPLYLKINNLLNKNMDIDDDWKRFLIQFEQKHTGFFKHMKQIEPNLTSNDLKLCACLKLNLASKDIASLMNISIRGVENSRYRLRKKLNIPQNQNLNDYFMNI